jgi:DNA-binding MarR family transcriptional regulator
LATASQGGAREGHCVTLRSMPEELRDEDYRRLLQFRIDLRRFLHWSEELAEKAGVTPAQHQLLLAIRGHNGAGSEGPTIGDVAAYLLLRHHSAVGLVDRAVKAGLIERREDAVDRRMVRLSLSDLGSQTLRQLSELHLEEIKRLSPRIQAISQGLEP